MKMNRIDQLFEQKSTGVLNIYYTAGYTKLEDTLRVAIALEKSGADLMEIGIPYSDPIADGTTIQESSSAALANGMSIKVLFNQLKDLRKHVSIPVVLMGYLNPVIQFGVESFCEKCNKIGIDGLIIPDLPLFEYNTQYRQIFEKAGLHNIALITPQTSEARIRVIDQDSNGFIYMVSSASVTGASTGISSEQIAYFNRIKQMKLRLPTLIGFGISDAQTFETACNFSNGAIIGSAFIRNLKHDASDESISLFIKNIKS